MRRSLFLGFAEEWSRVALLGKPDDFAQYPILWRTCLRICKMHHVLAMRARPGRAWQALRTLKSAMFESCVTLAASRGGMAAENGAG
jgi:hypothetical protein